jgi:hypothetical protein
MEEWKPLRDYDGYSVSDQGRVRSDKSNAVLAIGRTAQNRSFVKLMHQGRQKSRGLAFLVCEAFIPLPNYRCDTPTPIHFNGDLRDCRVTNLAWRPRWFAQDHTRQFRFEHKIKGAILTPVIDVETRIVYDDIWDVVLEHGVLYRDVLVSIQERTWVYPLFRRFEWFDLD